MENALVKQNLHWEGKYENLYHRSIMGKLISQLPAKEIQVLQGVRRSGKSTIFKLLINHLMESNSPKSILYINLDDPFFTELYNDARKFDSVVDIAGKLTQENIKYLFLDEVQNVEKWEKFVKSAYDTERFRKIFITGSNSSLLKGQYAQLLSGRYISDSTYPLKFKEWLSVENLNSSLVLLQRKSKVMQIIDKMLEFGGFPEIIKHEDQLLKREILLNYYETILLKDCIAINHVREVKTFKELTHYLISNAGTLYSYNGLAKSINSNENSVQEFINILENSFLFKEVKHFSFSLKKQSKARKKIYCVDNGILANVSFRFSQNKGKLFENLVYSELIKYNGDVYHYINKYECDFIVKSESEKKAIQVCFEISDQNQKREINGLREAMEDLKIENGTIITYNQEMNVEGISVLPFWKYFFKG